MHYYCDGGCGGVATEEALERKDKVCQMEGCDKYQKPLIQCDCDNMGRHKN